MSRHFGLKAKTPVQHLRDRNEAMASDKVILIMGTTLVCVLLLVVMVMFRR